MCKICIVVILVAHVNPLQTNAVESVNADLVAIITTTKEVI